MESSACFWVLRKNENMFLPVALKPTGQNNTLNEQGEKNNYIHLIEWKEPKGTIHKGKHWTCSSPCQESPGLLDGAKVFLRMPMLQIPGELCEVDLSENLRHHDVGGRLVA